MSLPGILIVAEHPPVLGDGVDISCWANIRPLDRLMIEPNFQYERLDSRDNGAELYSESVFRTKFSWQFNRRLSLRLVVQYDDSNITVYNNYEREFTVEPLLTYKVNPFTIFYIGSGHDYSDFGAQHGLTQSDRQVFLKLQYLFRI
ncbi:MAG: hypothetical protein QME66_08450 [Candidatus Eisenbacteria bacterium]|nr:hypothetical protein [Candidatus Eisenbacteria bacterium]